ncbi:MAG: DUF4197 domain-containing protein [Candidatus Rokuibacteriota bacterium]
MISRVLAGVVGLLLVTAPAWAQLDQILKGLGLGQPGTLSDAKIGMGLKEALQVATDTSVTLTGKVDGYFGNHAIKILMPEKLKGLETGLRAVGYGPQVDEFVLSMNRAAERAAPAARQIFLDAIGEMTFDDARKILNGGDTAATDFFKTRTTDRLMAAFKPVIDRSMNEVGVTRHYKELVGRFEAIPFVKTQAFDLDGYVTGKGLDGLFHVLGEHERQIRVNPAARTTDLLKDVFGKR